MTHVLERLHVSETAVSAAGHYVGDEGAGAIARALKRLPDVEAVALANNGITPRGARPLLRSLADKRALRVIDLSGNRLGSSRTMAEMGRIVGEAHNGGGGGGGGATLATIELRDCCISPRGAGIFAAALSENRALTRIDLSGNAIGDAGAMAIAAALETHGAMEHVAMRRCDIGDGGARALGAVLGASSTLTRLDVDENELGPVGVAALGAAMGESRSMELLCLSGNALGEEGARAIARALEGPNCSLRALHIARCDVDDTLADVLAEAMAVNESLTQLNLQGNGLTADGCSMFARALETNATVSRLGLQENEIGDGGCEALAAMLRVNTVLSELDVHANGIGADGCEALAQALHSNVSLTWLHLGGNAIPAAGGVAFFETMAANASLTHITLPSSATTAATGESIRMDLDRNRFRADKLKDRSMATLGEMMDARAFLNDELDAAAFCGHVARMAAAAAGTRRAEPTKVQPALHMLERVSAHVVPHLTRSPGGFSVLVERMRRLVHA